MERKQVFYSGRVQGVGLRFTAKRISSNFDVSGFVRNLPDGRVELVAEGSRAALQEFLREIAETMADYIDHIDERHAEPTSGFASFDIQI